MSVHLQLLFLKQAERILIAKIYWQNIKINTFFQQLTRQSMIDLSLKTMQLEFGQHQLQSHNSSKQLLQKKFKVREEMEMPDIRKGHWTKRQNMLYVMFLNYFEAKFSKKQNRRLWKIFKLMSEFIETRSPNQCRSHHQKMEKNYPSVKSIIESYKMVIPNYEERYSKLKNLLIQMNDQNSILAVNEAVQIDQNENFQSIRKMKFQNIFGTEDSQNTSEMKSQNSKINGKQQLNREHKIKKVQQTKFMGEQRADSGETDLNNKSRLQRAIIKYKKYRQQKMQNNQEVAIDMTQNRNQKKLPHEQSSVRASRCQCKARQPIIQQITTKISQDSDNKNRESQTRKGWSLFKGEQEIPHGASQNLNFRNIQINEQMHNEMNVSMQEGMVNQFIQSMAYFQMLLQNMQNLMNFNH